MAFTLLSHTSVESSAGSGVTTSAIDTTGAKLLIACPSHYFPVGSLGTGTPLTDSKGNSWSHGTIKLDPSSEVETTIFYCLMPSSAGTGHTFTFNKGASFPSLSVAAFGADETVYFDQQNSSSNATSTTHQTGSVTPTTTDQLIVAFCAIAYSALNTTGVDSSFSLIENPHSSVFAYSGGLAYQIQTTITARNPQFTLASSQRAALVIATFIDQVPPPDSNPPTVAITSPSTGGASVSGDLSIVATCSDDVHVTTLSLIVDDEIVDTFEDSDITGHTFTLDTLRFTNGSHVIKVRANDDYNDTDSSSITKTFANTFTITGDAKLASNASDTYTTNIPDPTWSKDSGGGSINASTGEYVAPSSGIGVAVLRATGEFDSTQTKNVLYGFPYEHNNGNSRTFDYADLPAGYDYKAQVKSVDEQSNTLGYTDWVEQP